MDDRWLERALATERELGAITERLRSGEHKDSELARADDALRQSLNESMRGVTAQMQMVSDNVNRSNTHVLGELNRLDKAMAENRKADEEVARTRMAEEQKRKDEIILQLKLQAEEAKQAAKSAVDKHKPYVAIVVFVGLFLQWVFENFSTVGRVLGELQ